VTDIAQSYHLPQILDDRRSTVDVTGRAEGDIRISCAWEKT